MIVVVTVIILPFKCFLNFFIDFSLNRNLSFFNQIALNNNGLFVFLVEVLFLHFPCIFLKGHGAWHVLSGGKSLPHCRKLTIVLF